MKLHALVFLFAVISSGTVAQPIPDSVIIKYNAAKTDEEKGKSLSSYLFSLKNDSLIFKATLDLTSYFKSKNDQVGQDYAQLPVIYKLALTGDFATALNQSLQILTRFEARQDYYGIAFTYMQIAIALFFAGDMEQSIIYYKKVIPKAQRDGNKRLLSASYSNMATAYAQINMPDSGLMYAQRAVNYAYEKNDSDLIASSLSTLGEIYIAKKEYDTAISIIRKSLLFPQSSDIDGYVGYTWVLNDFAQIFLEKNQHDSARHYAVQAVELAGNNGLKDQLLRAYEYLYKSYEKTDTRDSVYKYFRLAINTKDSLYTAKKTKEIQAINFREQLRKQEIEQDKIQLQNKIRTYALLAGLAMFSIVAFILYRNNRQKQKANKVLENTLSNLKSTQSQLIQSEKMASLGELTAGIAHEIQNPLNFVNNFSEVSCELIDEMKEELSKANYDEANAIAEDVKQNLEKINHHGKRADAIVKGMLQHSQTSHGRKEPTNISNLTNEYLRLSYHGLLAKDKTFNVTLITDFDETIGNVNIIPQDIGRVLLNLYNNAFYAVSQKHTSAGLPAGQAGSVLREGKEYEPTIYVGTKKMDNKILISVKDNGNGIPRKIADKIFQPFFTTKPTGQGTGLGLSLAYDIIKAHGGEIKVETKDGEGSEFVIVLPA